MRVGQCVDLNRPPSHCGRPLRMWDEPGGYLLECLTCGRDIHVNIHGQITETQPKEIKT